MRIRSILVAVISAACCAASAPGGTVRPVVPCDEAILDTAFPYRSGGYRPVLGAVAVPPSYLVQVVPSGSRSWPYRRKAGLVVRAGSPTVIVSVPPSWRTRAAIMWGNGSAGRDTASLAIAGCPGKPSTGHAYAGGFYLRAKSACVPITFRVGSRRQTVRFGLGRRW